MTVAADLRSDRGRLLLDRIAVLDAKLASERDRISEVLFGEIGGQADAALRRDLIALRRDLFSFRRPKIGSPTEDLLIQLSVTQPDLLGFVRSLDERAHVIREFGEVFDSDRDAIRQRLSAWVQTPDFQRGLLLGSESLFTAQAAYLRSPPSGTISGKLARTERGLLRYLLRASMKATPFSTFCIVAPGTLLQGNGEEGLVSAILGRLNPLRLSVRLNKRLYSMLTTRLAARPAIRNALIIETNPTIRVVGQNCVFLALSEGREAFQRVPASAVFMMLLSHVDANPGIRFGEFVAMIAEHEDIECTFEEASHYAEQMLAAGAIRLCYGIPEQEADWAPPLANLLAGISDPMAQELGASLRTLDACGRSSETAGLSEHVKLVAEMKRVAASVLGAIDVPGDAQLPFLEDATAEVRQEIRRTKALEKLESTMGRLIAAGLRISWPRTRQAELRHFFSAHFAGISEVPLLDFYEAFYREHFKQYLSLADRVSVEGIKAADGYDFENPFSLPLIEQIRLARGRLARLVSDRWAESPDVGELTLSLDEIEAITSEVPWTCSRPTSVVVLGTLARAEHAEGDLRFVCRQWQSGVGHGRMFSRWLHMLDPELLERLRQENAEFAESVRLAEIATDGGHNANLHPALLPWEISYPNSEGTRRANSIPPSELVVEPDPGDPHALRLRHLLSNTAVLPIDLGFLAIDSRPPLFQLLTAFAPPSGIAFPLPEPPAAIASGRSDGTFGRAPVIRLPRVVIGGIVASRRRWMIPHASLPKPSANQRDSDFAIRLDRWRRENGLPEVVYMRYENSTSAAPPPEVEDAAEGDASKPQSQKRMRARLNELKPQYLDFSSPLSTNLLQHEGTADRPPRMLFEEQYPTEAQVPTINGRPHAIEHIIQVTCRP